MLTAISESEIHYQDLTETRTVLRKFVHMSRFFEPRIQMAGNDKMYRQNPVDAQIIFQKELRDLNPDNE